MAATLKITETKKNNITILSLSGELDAKTAPDFRTTLDNLIAAGSVKIVCECQELTYVASAGIGVMNAIQKNAMGKSGEMILVGVQKEIRDTMELMYFTKKVRLLGTVDEAIAALG
ncbi:STAS domain-containing protein [Leptospira sp. GIMC2001]|uniref:STAS domain-containing protein n=1 Tax=Leptospira sp. GIMC2001 TaxID=1513297 RepID=UPI0023494D9F|nr:STAS domain-containing protein [Leptospira sp. GIMC2001]WCL50499.1 STAS domain-containing protein [Leptospira sp. GIMC2001]